MEEEASEQSQLATLCRQLGILDQSIGFTLLTIGGVLLSFWSIVIQRKGLCLTICGDTEAAGRLPPVFPLKCKASSIFVGALGFFLCLALSTLREAEQGGDCVAIQSARTNVWASLFVLVAAMLRLNDLQFVERNQKGLVAEDEIEPVFS